MSYQEQSPIRVLLVDDDAALLRSTQRSLTEHDMEVETASCAAEARVFLKHFSFDVILCDYSMPGKTGLEFLDEIKSNYPDSIRMILSGKIGGLEIGEKWAEEIGVSRVFSKPCDIEDIAFEIKKAVEHREPQGASKLNGA